MRTTITTNNNTTNYKRRVAIQFEMRKLFQDVYPNRKESEKALREAMSAFSSVKRDLLFRRLLED